jgi:hypothetical protein
MRSVARLIFVALAPFMKQFLGLKNARKMSVHGVVVRPSMGKRVRLGRLQEIM